MMVRLRCIVACLLAGAAVLGSYGGFAWFEMHRGRQVYPAGVLPRLIFTCLTVSLLLLALAAVIAIRNRAALLAPKQQDLQPAENRAPGRPWSVPVLLALSLAFTAFAVHHSRESGRLAFPPYYDDVGYFSDALNRLYVLYDHGVAAVVKNYAENPPHSPTSALLDGAGYAILGTGDWVPPLMNFTIVFGLLLFVRSRTRHLRSGWAIPVYVFAIAWPLLFLSVIHCIPDFLWSFSLAIAGWTALERPLTRAGPRTHFAIGLLFGLAFLSKPAAFPATGSLFACTLYLAWMAEFAAIGFPGIWSRSAAPFARILAGCALVCGPHYAVASKSEWDYFRLNSMGSRQDLWKYAGNLREQFLYYLTGDGGRYAMGGFLLLSVVLAAFGLGYAVIRRKRGALLPALLAAALFLFGHAAVSVTSYKSVFLGLFVPCFLWVCGVVLMAALLEDAQNAAAGRIRLAPAIACAAIAFVALLEFHPVPMKRILAHVTEDYPRKGVDFIREAQNRRMVVRRIVSMVSADPRRRLTVGWVRANLFNLSAVFAFQFQKNRAQQVNCVNTDSYPADLARFQSDVADADYLFYLSPSQDDQTKLIQVLNAGASWQVALRIDDPYDDGEILLLRKANTWQSVRLGMRGAEGFGGVEGPYPPSMPFLVRWGLGPRSVIPFSVDQTRQLVLHIEAGAPGGQGVTILLDGKPISSAAISPLPAFQTLELPFQVNAGVHTIAFRYSHWEKMAGRRPVAALFRKISLVAN
jgi:hypothetical protein